MKLTKEYRKNSRKSVDKRIQKIKHLEASCELPIGWLKTVRESLGLSVKMLDERLGLKNSVARAEQREREKTITIGTLDAMARGMGCKLVYAIVPLGGHETLEQMLEARATVLAREILKNVNHTMNLEAQGVGAEASLNEEEKLVSSLVETLDGRLWEGWK